MLAAELALARVDVAIVERRESQALLGTRAGGLHARSLEVLDQRGVAERFISQGQVLRVMPLQPALDMTGASTRHDYLLALGQNHIERILAQWVSELAVPIYRSREVTGFTQDDTRVSVELSDGGSLEARYLVGCDGGRSLVRKAAAIDFSGWDPTTSLAVLRVVDNFVAQWGDPDEGRKSVGDAARTLPAEFTIPFEAAKGFVKLADRDTYARETGWLDGFPAARDAKVRQA